MNEGQCIATTWLDERCKRTGAETIIGALCSRHYFEFVGELRERDRLSARKQAAARLRAERAKQVYYAQQGDFIKIGYSSHVPSRLRALTTSRASRPDDLPTGPVALLATHDGGPHAERALHERYAHLRVSGEWFRATPELLAHIAHINERHANGVAA